MGTKEEKIKLAFIEESSELGGAQLNDCCLQKHLDRKRYDTVVICSTEGPLTQELRRLAVPVHILPMKGLKSTSSRIGSFQFFNPFAVIFDVLVLMPSVFRLKRLLRELRVHIAVTNGMFSHFYGGWGARLARIPCIWHFDRIVRPDLMFGLVRKMVNVMASILPKAIIVPSEAVKREMFLEGNPSKKVVVIYNAADRSEFDPSSTGSRLRTEYSIDDNNIVVGILSRLTHWKGHKEFLRAGKKVIKKNSKVKLMIVGGTVFESNKYESELKLLAQRLGLERNVIFTGFRRDIPECIASMDICVLPSILPDPSPRVLFEGMAMGKPFIGSNGGGVPEIIVHGETGLLVPLGDVNRLAEAILYLAHDFGARIEMGQKAQYRSQNAFSFEKFLKEHCRIFEQVWTGVSHV